MLTINLEFRKGILFIRLKGKLNKDTVYKLNKRVIKLVKENGIRNTVINTSNLKQIDMKGINSLYYLYETVKDNNGTSMLCGVSDKMQKIFKKAHMFKYMLNIETELDSFNILEGVI